MKIIITVLLIATIVLTGCAKQVDNTPLIEHCIGLDSTQVQNDCVSPIAIEQKDPSLCAYVEPASTCMKTLIDADIYKGNCNEEYLITSSKVDCWTYTAHAREDPELCERVKELDGVNNPEVFSSVGTTMEKVIESCVRNIVMQGTDPEQCNKIILDKDQADCVYMIAEKANNPSFCEHIRDATLADKCTYFLTSEP